MTKGYIKLLVVMILNGAICLGDDGCYRPRGCQRPVNCAKPKDTEPESGTTVPDGTFVPGPTRGEVAGESSALGLRLGTLRIPELSIALPTLQLPSFVKFRKDAVMHTESGTAAFVRGDVNEFGLTPRRSDEPESGTQDKDEDETGTGCVPPCPNIYERQPCYPPQPCGEGCTKLFNNKNSADPWQNSMQHQFAVREEQVAKLESQVIELQKLVERLAVQKEEASSVLPSSAPVQRPRSQNVDPWNQNSAPVQTADTSHKDEQAEQIAMLQAKLEELSKSQQTAKLTSSEQDVAEPLIRQETRQPERELSKREKSTAKSGFFSRLGMTLTRR